MRIPVLDFFSMNREKWYRIRQRGMYMFVFEYFFLPFVIVATGIDILIAVFRRELLWSKGPLLQEIIAVFKSDVITWTIVVIPLGFIVWFLTERHYSKPGHD